MPSQSGPGPLEKENTPSTRFRVSAVIPAYNEEERVVDVLDTIAHSTKVDEILVVTDGCTDDTAGRIRAWLQTRPSDAMPVRLFELKHNIGKGGAMAHGAHVADADILLFLDADLIGLQSHQVDDLVAPLLREEKPADMALGLFGAVRGGLLGWWLSYNHRIFSFMTGQRAIRRDLFLAVPGLTRSRFGVEAAITCFVQSDPELKVEYTYLHAVTHPIKEEKLGPWRGFRKRSRMYREVWGTMLKHRAKIEMTKQRNKAQERIQRFGNK
jgi:glycosyltransferase involved in cell wall biosynthesis